MEQYIAQQEYAAFPHLVQVAEDEAKRCLDAQRRSHSKLVFGLTSALKLHLMELPQDCRLSDEVQVCVATAGQRSKLSGVSCHALQSPMTVVDIDLPTGDTLAVTDKVTTCMQMAGFCSKEETVMLFDALMRRHNPDKAMFKRDLQTYLHDSGEFRGKQAARWAWERARENTDSPMESRLRVLLDGSRLTHAQVNMLFTDPVTGEQWLVDLAYPELGIILEYQGMPWHVGERQVKLDANRSSKMQRHGCIVLAVTADNMRTPQARAELVCLVRDTIRRRKSEMKHRRMSFAHLFTPLASFEPAS